MIAIEARDLRKTYQVFRKQSGMWGAVRGLFVRRYEPVHAVAGVSFQIEQGEIVAFLGPNGAGKTTTLKLLSGLIHPSSGEARVLGYVPWKRESAYRRRFALVMGQKNQLWWDLPALDSFGLHREIYRIPEKQYQARLDELTAMLEVRHLVRQPVRELSLGERMRMELIAALLHRPEVLFLDEPTIGLDVVSQRTVLNFLKAFQAELKITVILTSHYMKDVQTLCQRAIIINEGELKHDGPLEQIVDRFSTYKVIELQFADGNVPADLARFGEPFDMHPPRAKLRVPRAEVPNVLGGLLARYAIEDVAVQDRPLEEAIAEMFTSTRSVPSATAEK